MTNDTHIPQSTSNRFAGHERYSKLLLRVVALILTFYLTSCATLDLMPAATSAPDPTAPEPNSRSQRPVPDTSNSSAIRGGTGATSAEAFAAPPDGDQATVTKIIDGDTIDVQLDGRSQRVRYIGDDTPERDMPFYAEANSANAELVKGQTVILVKDVSETDRFGRLLRYVYLPDGTFVNAELLRRGFAQAVTFPPDVAYAEAFAGLQAEAAAAGLGLWADSALAAQATATRRSDAPSVVTITNIHATGSGRNEPDEWVEFRNDGSQPLQLEGWRLLDEAEHTFNFPNFLMQPGQSCRVYTNEHHADWCGFSYGNGQPIWNNRGDCATLYDAEGVVVARSCY